MLSKKNNILQFNQYMKSEKTSYIIYTDLESLIRKIDGCENNPEKFSTTKMSEHIPCRYSISAIWVFDNIENKHTLYRGENCMEKFVTTLINFEKKKILPLTKKELKLHQDATACYICKKRFLKEFARDNNYRKVRDHCHLTRKY